MDFLRFRVRADWPEVSRALLVDARARWRVFQVVVVSAVLVALLLTGLDPDRVSVFLIQSALMPLLLTPVFWFAVPHTRRLPRRAALLCFVLILAAAAITWWTLPRGLDASGLASVTNGPWWLIVIAPLLSFYPLRQFNQVLPLRPHGVGLSFTGWPAKVVIGILVGLMLGIHLVIFTRPWLPFRREGLTFLPLVAWLFISDIALRVPMDELVFRRVGMGLRPSDERRDLLMTILLTSGMNATLYLTAALSIGGILGLCVLGYRLIAGLAHAVLFHKSGSLIPGVTSNLVFSLILSMVITA